MKDNLHHLLNPESVAIIGASRNPNSFSYPIVETALRYGYEGKLYLINPNADSVLGLKCYSKLTDVPDDVDVALITVPKHIATQAIEDCIEKKVKGFVIITAGYAESGSTEGKELQEKLVAKAVEEGIRVIGPNTLGYFSAAKTMDMIMSGFIKKGYTALLTQSGNLTQSLTFPGAQRGLGFSYVVDIGNQADLQAQDFMEYFADDLNTRSIAVHIEGLRDGRKFMAEVSRAVTKKPVVVFKSGRTDMGAKIVSSHTASIAGDDKVYQAALRQCGAIQVESFHEFASLLLAFNQGKTAGGNKMCIISEGGGDCAVTSDACILKGLSVPELSEHSQTLLKQIIPKNGSVKNPIDLAGWENVVEATQIALADENIDGVIIVGGFAGYFNISPNDFAKEKRYVEQMCEVVSNSTKPVHIYSYFSYKNNELLEMLKDHHIPLFADHHDAVASMAALVQYNADKISYTRRQFNPEYAKGASSICLNGQHVSGKSVLEPYAKEMLSKYDISHPSEKLVQTPEEAAAFAEEIGYPVVMKIVSGDILHKSDAGCVKLNIHDKAGIVRAFEDILSNAKNFNANADIAGFLVAKMDCSEGVEVIIGGVRDAIFGPAIMFGLGGVSVEVLKDVSLRVCPVDEDSAEDMIREIKGFKLLNGFRGAPAYDIDSIKQALVNVSRLLLDNPDIAEIDLNPVKVHQKGLNVLDVRVLLH